MAREVVVRITCDQCGKKFFAEPDKHYSLQVGDRVYEFCDECRGKLLDALDGKGEKVRTANAAPIIFPIVPVVSGSAVPRRGTRTQIPSGLAIRRRPGRRINRTSVTLPSPMQPTIICGPQTLRIYNSTSNYRCIPQLPQV